MRMIVQPALRRLDPELTSAVRRRLLLALSTYSPQIAQVAVYLPPPPTSSSHPHPRCRVVLRLREGAEVAVEEADETPLAAVSRAADRVARWVRRQLLQQQEARPRVLRTPAATLADSARS